MICEVINAYLPTAGGGTKFNLSGLTSTSDVSQSYAANKLSLAKMTTPAYSSTVKSLCLRQHSTTAAGTHLKPVIYTDSGGNPGTLIAVGDELATSSLSVTQDIVLTFPNPLPTLSASTDYWIGFINDAAFVGCLYGDTVQYRLFTNAYSNGAPSSPGSGTGTNYRFCCYLSLTDGSALSAATGYVSNVTTAEGFGDDRIRIALPADHGPNDLIVVHVTYLNTSAGPTWFVTSGYTQIDQQQIGSAVNYREVAYWKRLNGTEGYFDILETGSSSSVIQLTLSLWRGYVTAGTPYEAEATVGNTNTSPAGSTISTLGTNRTVVNLYSNETAVAPGNAGANGWADAYALTTLVGNDCASTLSWKDVANASSVTAESRTFGSALRWRSFTFALIKA